MWFILREKTSARIRTTMYWPLIVVVYLYIAGWTVTSWFALIDDVGIQLPDEEVGVPVLFGVMLFLIAFVFYFKVWRPHKRAMKEFNK